MIAQATHLYSTLMLLDRLMQSWLIESIFENKMQQRYKMKFRTLRDFFFERESKMVSLRPAGELSSANG